MGCCSSENVSANTRPVPSSSPGGMINHPVFRLQPHEKVIEDHAWIGQGVKKTPAFRTTLTENQLGKWREDFWSSRTIDGKGNENWNAIRLACQSDPGKSKLKPENAKAIILAQGLIMNSTSLSLIYDQKGKAYFVPMSCINNPLEYFVEKKEDPNGPKEVVSVMVVLRNPKHGDTKIKMLNNAMITQLKQQYLKKVNETKGASVRLFFSGSQLTNEHSLFYYNLGPEKMLHAFIRHQ